MEQHEIKDLMTKLKRESRKTSKN